MLKVNNYWYIAAAARELGARPIRRERIEQLAGHCPDYGYDCEARPASQSECFLALLLALDDPCLLFSDGLRCAGNVPSIYGLADCALQECFELTTAEACSSNLEVLCSYL